MPRALTVARVRVRAGREAEYLASVAELAALARARGWHLWVFRHPGEAGLFLEFSESRDAASHRTVADRPADEQALEVRLREVADYEPGGEEIWEEVALDTRR